MLRRGTGPGDGAGLDGLFGLVGQSQGGELLVADVNGSSRSPSTARRPRLGPGPFGAAGPLTSGRGYLALRRPSLSGTS